MYQGACLERRGTNTGSRAPYPLFEALLCTDGLEGVIVRHDIKDIHGLGGLPGRILFLATGGGGYRRQTCQNE